MNQWGEDVDLGPTELSPPESEQGAEWACCAAEGPVVLVPGGPAVWGDCGHPTVLQEGKWGGHSRSRECQDRSKSDIGWPNRFALSM